MFRRAAPKLLLIAMAFASCADGGGVESDDSADALPLLAAREELRVGDLDDPEIGFASIAGVTVGPDGLIYVLERQDLEVRVYDAEGNRVNTIGRAGEGPGEFQRPTLIGFRGDTLWVNDGGSRVTFFDREGEVLATFPMPSVNRDLGNGVLTILQAGVLREDGLFHSGQGMFGFLASAAGSLPDSVLLPEVVFDRSGELLDTTGYSVRRMGSGPTVPIGGRDFSAPRAPSDEPLRVHDPRGALIVDRPRPASSGPSAFTVTRTDLAGDTIYTRTLGYTPSGFTSAFMDTLVVGRAESLARALGEEPEAVARAFRSVLDLPDFQTPVIDAEVGVDGSVWLRREDDGGPVFRWVLLDPEGEPVGRLELPRSFNPLWIDGEAAYGSLMDDFDIPWLVRYRVGPA